MRPGARHSPFKGAGWTIRLAVLRHDQRLAGTVGGNYVSDSAVRSTT
ncbi:hypothetical protein [Streptomyces adustus]